MALPHPKVPSQVSQPKKTKMLSSPKHPKQLGHTDVPNTADTTTNLDIPHLPIHSATSQNNKNGTSSSSKLAKGRNLRAQSSQSSYMHVSVLKTTELNAHLPLVS